MAELSTTQRTGAAATVGIVAAIASVVITLTGHPMWGLLAGVAGLVAGGIGLLMSASPRVSGGMLSIGAIVLSIFGIGLGVIGAFTSLLL
ncbi:MAG TPA: hypothetical protein VD963_02590 [Phycisphaerales bacterium]|nr:hypothetical protein [Phycisphaerales bacterium]